MAGLNSNGRIQKSYISMSQEWLRISSKYEKSLTLLQTSLNDINTQEQLHRTTQSSRRTTTEQVPIPRDLYLDQVTGKAYLPSRGTDSNSTSDHFVLMPYTGPEVKNRRRLASVVDGTAQHDGNHRADHRMLQDTVKPTISGISPGNRTTLPSIFEVRANITDNTKVTTASVAFYNLATKTTSRFTLSSAGSNVWSATVRIDRAGLAHMTISASDAAGNTATTAISVLTISTYTSLAKWESKGARISKAAGRIVFEMLDQLAIDYTTYVCSGTLIQLPTDAPSNRSIVMTAAHCVYDDVNKEFARNALFIPQQDDGGSDVTDTDCTNDALGCLPLDYGFVSDEWTGRIFPNNMGYDYGFYVSTLTKTKVKGKTIGVRGDIVPMRVNFGPVSVGSTAYALGYSDDEDPQFMYSVDAISFDKSALGTNYLLGRSRLTGGASGGPWTLDNPATTTGPVNIIATNSWSRMAQPGVFASPINTGGAACVYDSAVWTKLADIKGDGKVVSCPT